MSQVVSQTELASLLSLSTRQIRNLEKEGMPKGSDGQRSVYEPAACVRWYVQYRERLAAPKDQEDAEKRRAIAEAQLAELKLAKEQGKVVEVETVGQEVDGMLEQLRNQLLTLPQRWAPQTVGLKTLPEATQVLEAAVLESLAALSRE